MAYTLIDDEVNGGYTLIPDDPVTPTVTPKLEAKVFGLTPSQWGNLAAGGVRGAGSIGATILSPLDATGITGMTNDERRQKMDAALTSFGANPESTEYGTGKLGVEIAGTSGVGGVLAKGVNAASKVVPALAPYVPKLTTALETAGFRTTPARMVGPYAAPTLIGKAGDLALRTGSAATVGGTAAGVIDPDTAKAGALIGGAIPGGVKAAGMVGSGVKSLAGSALQHALGLFTGAGSNAIKTAFESGKAGSVSFLDNMRGNVSMTDVLDDAKAALSKMRLARGEEYRNGMARVSSDKTVLDFTPIDNAVSNIASMGAYKGQQINKNASGVVNDLLETVNNWKSLNPAEYHTPEGLDALKQSIGDIRDSTQFGTAARRAADSVYNAVKNQITAQAPVYSKTMKAYSEASDLLTEIQRTLTGGEKTSVDTAMRKLQSLMRNNVNTNYGNRLDLARELEMQGGKELLPSIAGQALSSLTPRGLQGLAATGTGIYSLTNPAALAALPFTSPRLMGEASYGLGRFAGSTGNVLNNISGQSIPRGTGGLLGNPEELLKFMTLAPAIGMSR